MGLFEEALAFAAAKHAGQTRKMTKTPYFLHPMEVAAIVGTMTDDETVIAAALLHDTVEDTDATLPEIAGRFGERVASLVASETEPKCADVAPDKTWEARKNASLEALAACADEAVLMIWLGDKLSNMRSIAREYRAKGEAIWQAFHQHDPARHAWYYRRVAEILRPLSGVDAYSEYLALVGFVFGKDL